MVSDAGVKLADCEDIPEGKGIVVIAPNGDEIALFKWEGKIYALDNNCPHMGGPLGEGEIKGGTVTCPWHGWQFTICNGACLNMPGDDAKTVAIVVKNGGVFLKGTSP